VGQSEKLVPARSLDQGQLSSPYDEQVGRSAGSTEVAGTSGQGQQVQVQVQHTVHELEPLTRYTMRVIAVNAVGRSRPSVALSLRTEEEGE